MAWKYPTSIEWTPADNVTEPDAPAGSVVHTAWLPLYRAIAVAVDEQRAAVVAIHLERVRATLNDIQTAAQDRLIIGGAREALIGKHARTGSGRKSRVSSSRRRCSDRCHLA